MPLLGAAGLAMWWDMDAAHRAEFEHWHSHEHFPERLRIPGFQRGSRWVCTGAADGDVDRIGARFFVLYELASYETLTSPDYVARLNDPTPWSQQMMPRHRHMVRSQCRVLGSQGGGLGGAMLTVRLSPQPGRAGALQDHLQSLLDVLPQRAGLVAAHLLQTQTPAVAVTTEQKIRGGADGVADWVVLVSGYEAQALHGLCAGELGAGALHGAGALRGALSAVYNLCCAMTPADL